jgi:hypothetical protein
MTDVEPASMTNHPGHTVCFQLLLPGVQEAVKFTAAVAPLLPAPAGCSSKAPSADSLPNMLQKFMLVRLLL